MKHSIYFVIITMLFVFLSCSIQEKRNININTAEDSLTLVLTDSLNHIFTFTNKQSGFFMGNTRRLNESGFEGWTVSEFHYLKDYEIYLGGKKLQRNNILGFHYMPHGFKRFYDNGLVETFVLLDSIDAVILKIEPADDDETVKLLPVFHQNIIGLKGFLGRGKRQLVVSDKQFGANDQTPLKWMGVNYIIEDNQSITVLFMLDDNLEKLQQNIKKLAAQCDTLIEKRKERFKETLAAQNIELKNKELTKAALWAKLSLDALVTNQRGKGIWAGLPWFNNYWGRDTFISLAGALLVSGEFQTAKQIFENFADFQLTNPNKRLYGRIPNRITNNEIIYNTADGTGWFIRELYEYYLYTADKQFILKMYPAVKRALDGALKYRTDRHGFLIHGEAETWMDATGPEGARSPRGNRAVEVQALWYTGLQIGLRFASLRQNSNADAKRWRRAADRLRKNFNTYFWNDAEQCLYDHLNKNNKPDKSLRPNQVFAVTVPGLYGIEPLLPVGKQKKVAKRVAGDLTFEYGVTSLWQNDVNFHPWHHYPPYYVQDAAYHNGTVWTWLAGPVISSLLKFNQTEAAQTLYLNEAEQIIHNNGVGNYSELLDAHPRPGKKTPDISGTVSQAWSLAEFERNLYQDFIGYQPIAPENCFELTPHFCDKLNYIKTNLPYKNGYFEITLENTEQSINVSLKSMMIDESINGKIFFKSDKKPVNLTVNSGGVWEYLHLKLKPKKKKSEKKEIWNLAAAAKRNSFPVINQLDYDTLNPEDIYFPDYSKAKKIIAGGDKKNDDKGVSGKYSYPLNINFKKGILDIREFSIYDAGNDWGVILEMSNLTDPGWHKEYGFQLTFAAIAVFDASLKEKRNRIIGKNANYRLSARRAFNRIIYVGGGFEIRDAAGKFLASYVPVKDGFPMGFTDKKQICFKIPKSYLPGLSGKSKITILTGAQDDHGGAGMGDFRAVLKQTGVWHGGGAANNKRASRVYDTLEVN